MAETAVRLGDQSAASGVRRRSAVWVFISVGALALADATLAVLVFALSFELRHDSPLITWSRGGFPPFGLSADFAPYVTILGFVPVVKVYALRRFGLYRLRGEFSLSDDFFRVVRAATLSFLVLVLIAFLFRQGFAIDDGRLTKLDFSYSRLVFVYDWLISLTVFWFVRTAVRVVQIVSRSNGRNLIPAIVVGSGETAQICVAEMARKSRLGYRLVGVVTARPNEDTGGLVASGGRVLGDFDTLPELVKRYGIEEVLITDTRISPRKLFEVLMECGRDHHIKYRVVPNLFDCMPGKTEVATIGALPMIKLYEEPLRGPKRALKRGMDVIVSLLLLLLTWPLWVAVAVMIKLESQGRVFLRQERVGMDGKVFMMLKFRSMQDAADDEPHRELMKRMINGEEANQGTSSEPLYGKVKNDPRLTRIGNWIRRHSIDELPQVINVLKGEMSVVGPRPPIPYEVRHYKDWHRARFHVRPGITGLWQVSGRNRLHFEEMVRLDVFYIENWSPLLDLKIMLKTFPVVVRGDSTW